MSDKGEKTSFQPYTAENGGKTTISFFKKTGSFMCFIIESPVAFLNVINAICPFEHFIRCNLKITVNNIFPRTWWCELQLIIHMD